MAKSNIASKLLKLFDQELSAEILRAEGVPKDIGILDPFAGENSSEVKRIVGEFHRKYYSDQKKRMLMFGINPGRLGAGSTGLAFTDTKRCLSDLDIEVAGMRTHEPSSDFFYRMIREFGGPDVFYSQVYVSSVVPLGFTIRKNTGNHVNINYYDRKDLEESLKPFIVGWIKRLIDLGFRTDVAFCIGTGKNMKFLSKLNKEHGFFNELVPLEHPRYVMQYKVKSLDVYIEKYIREITTR